MNVVEKLNLRTKHMTVGRASRTIPPETLANLCRSCKNGGQFQKKLQQVHGTFCLEKLLSLLKRFDLCNHAHKEPTIDDILTQEHCQHIRWSNYTKWMQTSANHVANGARNPIQMLNLRARSKLLGFIISLWKDCKYGMETFTFAHLNICSTAECFAQLVDQINHNMFIGRFNGGRCTVRAKSHIHCFSALLKLA